MDTLAEARIPNALGGFGGVASTFVWFALGVGVASTFVWFTLFSLSVRVVSRGWSVIRGDGPSPLPATPVGVESHAPACFSSALGGQVGVANTFVWLAIGGVANTFVLRVRDGGVQVRSILHFFTAFLRLRDGGVQVRVFGQCSRHLIGQSSRHWTILWEKDLSSKLVKDVPYGKAPC